MLQPFCSNLFYNKLYRFYGWHFLFTDQTRMSLRFDSVGTLMRRNASKLFFIVINDFFNLFAQICFTTNCIKIDSILFEISNHFSQKKEWMEIRIEKSTHSLIKMKRTKLRSQTDFRLVRSGYFYSITIAVYHLFIHLSTII